MGLEDRVKEMNSEISSFLERQAKRDLVNKRPKTDLRFEYKDSRKDLVFECVEGYEFGNKVGEINIFYRINEWRYGETYFFNKTMISKIFYNRKQIFGLGDIWIQSQEGVVNG